MHFGLTGDTDIEAGLGSIIDNWAGPIRQHFFSKSYGPGLLGIVVVLMCQNPGLNLKQRVRLVKKEKRLYMDLMLDLNEMKQIEDITLKRRTVVVEIVSEVSAILKKYSIPDFDATIFIEDLKNWFKQVN